MRGLDIFPWMRGPRARHAGWRVLAALLILSLSGCGNDNGNSGGSGGGSGGITVTVNPPAAQVQLNQALQMSVSVSGAPNLSIAATNGVVRTTNVVTVTTTANHGFAVGNIVSIQGATDTSFLGTFTIASVPSATTFTYSQNGVNASSGNGTIPHTAVTWQVNNTAGGNAQVGTITGNGLYTAPAAIPPATTATITASGAVRASGTVTLTTAAAHTFQVGQIISVTGVTPPPAVTATITASGAVRASNSVTITTTAAHTFVGGQAVTISGVTDSSFNGTFVIISVPSSTTFTFLQTAADATSGSGSASATPQGFNGTFAVATVPNNTSMTYTQNGANATSGNGTVSSAAVQVKAISVADSTKTGTSSIVLDSGISLTINPTAATLATGDTLPFTATNSGPTTTLINWLVNDIAGGNATVGTISATGLYTAPAAVPAPATVTVKAQAAADLTKTVTAAVTISTPATPTLTALSPLTIAQGSGFQDFYLVGTNFLTTTVVRINGVPVPVSPTAVSVTLLRARIPANFFAGAGTFPVDLQAQGGAASAAINITITPERPALIGTAPDSVVAGTPTVTTQFNGGYYSPSVVAEFSGNTRAATLVASSQLDVPLSGADLANPGLYSVAVRNAAASQPLAAVNLAVQPTATPAVVGTVGTGGTNPSAIAVNPATGVAVVANRGSGTIARIDIGTAAVVGAPIPVCGSAASAPTGVAVDALRGAAGVAVVACNGTDNISIVDLFTGAVTQTIASPLATTGGAALKPFAVAVNSVSGLAIVANANTNLATVIDLATNSILGVAQIAGTGTNPEVAVDPRLNWALITAGGAGSTSIVDLGRVSPIAASNGAVRNGNVVTITTVVNHGAVQNELVTIAGVTDASFNGTFRVTSVPSSTTFTYDQTAGNASSAGGKVIHPGLVASITLGTGVRGVAVNPETHRALLVDQTSGNSIIFSLLDQTVANPLNATGGGFSSAAVNPLTNIGVIGNFTGNNILLVDLGRPDTLGSIIGVGAGPRAIAIDPGSNRAVVANETSGNVSIVDLGGLGTRPHIIQSAPLVTLSSGGGITLNITGSNLTGGTVRLDGTALTTTGVSARQLTATVPAAMLAGARRYAVDVQTGSGVSNVSELTVIQAVAVGTSPAAVAIDPERNEAIVTNSGSNNISIVNLATGAVSAPISVGTSPQGVAVIPRLARAVVTNFGSNNASLVDLAAGTVTGTVSTGSGPLGVAINPDDAQAIVANSNSNSVSFFPADTGGTAATSTVDIRPVGVAIDPVRKLAGVINATLSSVSFISLPAGSIASRVTVSQLPNGVVFDPESDRFLVISSLGNNLALINAVNSTGQTVRVGINPTSLAYNRHSSTLVTVNAASNTMSVMDFRSKQVREVMSLLGSAGSPQQGVDIHPRTNLAVVVDQANNRVLLIPLPR